RWPPISSGVSLQMSVIKETARFKFHALCRRRWRRGHLGMRKSLLVSARSGSRKVANMHHGDVVGVKPAPARQMIEQRDRRTLGAEQGPGDPVFSNEPRQFIAGERNRLDVPFDERVTVEIAAVDKRFEASEDQIPAERIV